MPVRIYDLARKLGLESKDVLSKAKEMGIAAARVPSSSLDKITAEYLEEQLRAAFHIASPAPPTPPAVSTPEPVAAAPPPAEPPPTVPMAAASPEIAVSAQAPAAPVPSPAMPVTVEAKAVPAVPVSVPHPSPALPPTPPPPPAPKIGELVGRITLPPKPQPRASERGPAARQPPRPGGARQDQRGGRGGQQLSRPSGPVPRPPTPQPRPAVSPPPSAAPPIVLPDTAEVIALKLPVIVRELAEKLGKKPFQIIADLINDFKVIANVNQPIVDESVVQRLCAKYGYKFEVEKRERRGPVLQVVPRTVELDPEDNLEQLLPRAPVVTIMGHVDHGKTTLLDVIRKANVAAGEAGGITQHIGAYTITVPHPERKGELAQITFLDTPGHAAFTAMRARGANVTDIVVLVVAANDGVMPQTLEALNHARAARVPILVAVNKCDHPNANPMKVRQQLQDKGLVPDDWGGDTIFADVSALTKQGIDKLLEMILLQAELLELKANPNRRAKGNVIESGLEPGGPTATVLVRKGTLKVGDVVLCGPYYGKVRALTNEEGKRLKEAGPSVAVKLLGLNGVPEAGQEFTVVEDDKAARALAEQRAAEAKELAKEQRAQVTLETLFETIDAASAKVLKVVVKADAQGSVEAIVEALNKIESDKVSLEMVHHAVGTISENDVLLASASKAIILGFHTRVDTAAAELAKREGVQIKLYTIIYELIDQVKEAMAGLIEPDLKETVTGAAEIKQVFELSKGGKVAGCVVTHGRVVKGKVRVVRRKHVIYEGILQTLRRFQDEVTEVRSGLECGIRLDGFGDFQVGDTIECYSVEKVASKL
jgi:translation initiation factor IF-2